MFRKITPLMSAFSLMFPAKEVNLMRTISRSLLGVCLLLGILLPSLAFADRNVGETLNHHNTNNKEITINSNNQCDSPNLNTTSEKNSEEELSIINSLTTNSQLRAMADQIFHEQVTPEFTQLLYDCLTNDQQEVVTKRLAELIGVSYDQIKRESASEGSSHLNSRSSGPGPGYDVQMPAGTGNPNVGTSSSWQDPHCDSDPSDPDWVFFANTSQTVSPSQMRWYATNSRVTWALNYAYNGILSTYGSHLYQINVCLGSNGVTLAGGFYAVQVNLHINYK